MSGPLTWLERWIHRGTEGWVPKDADPGLFILSDGKRLTKPAATRPVSIGQLFEEYRATLPQ